MKAGKVVPEAVCLYSPQLWHGRRHHGLVHAVEWEGLQITICEQLLHHQRDLWPWFLKFIPLRTLIIWVVTWKSCNFRIGKQSVNSPQMLWNKCSSSLRQVLGLNFKTSGFFLQWRFVLRSKKGHSWAGSVTGLGSAAFSNPNAQPGVRISSYVVA